MRVRMTALYVGLLATLSSSCVLAWGGGQVGCVRLSVSRAGRLLICWRPIAPRRPRATAAAPARTQRGSWAHNPIRRLATMALDIKFLLSMKAKMAMGQGRKRNVVGRRSKRWRRADKLSSTRCRAAEWSCGCACGDSAMTSSPCRGKHTLPHVFPIVITRSETDGRDTSLTTW